MQGGEEGRSETYLVVRENDERRSQRRRWAFFNSRLEKESDEELGDTRGFRFALTLDRDGHGRLESSLDLLHLHQRNPATDLRSDGDRGGKAHSVEPVVDRHLRAIPGEHLLETVR